MAEVPGSGHPESSEVVSDLDPHKRTLLVPQDLDELRERGTEIDDVAIQFSSESAFRHNLCDLRNFITIWSAGLAQVALPVIGDGVAQYSRISRRGGNVFERLEKSAQGVCKIVTAQDAQIPGNELRGWHEHIYGEDIGGNLVQATQPEPYTWGWLTIMDMVRKKIETTHGEQPDEAWWEQWYQEGRIGYICQGNGDELMPESYGAYRAYLEEFARANLTRTPTLDAFISRAEAGEIERPRQIPTQAWNTVTRRAMSWYVKVLAVRHLSDDERQNMEINPLTAREEKFADWVEQGTRNGWWAVPDQLGVHPSTAREVCPPRWPHQELMCRMAKAAFELDFSDGEEVAA